MNAPTPKQIKPYVEKKLVSEQTHPEFPELSIFNYTHKCQIDREWDGVTMQCRGLIYNTKMGQLVARPFPKFFNLSEYDNGAVEELDILANDEPEVYEKYDGSLGILYRRPDGKPAIATRGSFESEQAQWATKWFQSVANYEYFNDDYTYLFEILVKWNRIVVKYDYQGLVILSALDKKTGHAINLPEDTRQMQTWTARDDKGEYLYTPIERMEALQEVSKIISKERPGEAQGEKAKKHQGLAQKKQEKSVRPSQKNVSEDTTNNKRCQECSMCRLWKELPVVCDGFGSCEGAEKHQCWLCSWGEEDIRRIKEMRSCLCKLSQRENMGFKIVSMIHHTDWRGLHELAQQDKEGFVIYFPKSNKRVKVKFDDYIRIHKIMTGLSIKGIWEYLREHGVDANIYDIAEDAPDEFYDWLKREAVDLKMKYMAIVKEARMDYKELYEEGLSRKELAQRFTKTRYPSILFAELDNKDWDGIVWKMIEPKGSVPVFHKDIDL